MVNKREGGQDGAGEIEWRGKSGREKSFQVRLSKVNSIPEASVPLKEF